MILIKREEIFQKLSNISMMDSVKKLLFGPKNMNKTLQISVKANINYTDEEFVPRSSSAKKSISSDGVVKPFVNSNEKNGKARLTVVSSSPVKKNSNNIPSVDINPRNHKENRGSIYAVKSAEEEFMAQENSLMDEIFRDDFEAEFENVERNLNDYMLDLEARFAKENYVNEIEKNFLQNRAKEAIDSLFEMQKIYYDQFNKTHSLNKRLKELLIKYNEKFRTMLKKYNRLRESFESNNIRKILTNYNCDENKRIIQTIQQHQNELAVLKKLFMVDYTQNDFENYKQEIPTKKQNSKNLLLKLIKNIAVKNANALNDNHKINLDYITSKYRVNDSLNMPIKEEVDEENENEINRLNEFSLDPKQLNYVITSSPDAIDVRLDSFYDEYVNKYLQSRPNIPVFNKKSEGFYEFSSIDINVTFEDGRLKVSKNNSKDFTNFELFLTKFFLDVSPKKSSTSKPSLNGKVSKSKK